MFECSLEYPDHNGTCAFDKFLVGSVGKVAAAGFVCSGYHHFTGLHMFGAAKRENFPVISWEITDVDLLFEL